MTGTTNKVKKLILATGNKGKIREINALFADMDIEFIGLGEYPDLPEIIEDGINGYLCENESHVDLADKIMRVLKGRERFSPADIASRTLGRYGKDIIIREYERVFRTN